MERSLLVAATTVQPLSTEFQRAPSHREHTAGAVWKVVQQPAVALFLTYFVTLAIFPVITSDLTSVQECRSPARIRNDMFAPLTFLVFNLGDLVGRFAVPEETVEKDSWRLPRRLVLASVARFAFLPIFFLCYSRKSLYKDVAIHSDAFSWLVQFIFAVTNGVLTTVSFSVAATLLPADENLQQIASSILNLSLCLGLVAGGLAASPLLWLFSGH
jgi:equilibrative nucleoside transporter 1/2/3